ncbi:MULTISPECIES: hypothetical protein [unclassified Paraflavitalea]|uniref:hypothetical protein n=1 Tax=unclassified Paraflavitalea TaxID=2798305 RepID=UPI003D346AB0
MRFTVLFALILINVSSVAQPSSFPERCIGLWKGAIDIYSKGVLKQQIPVTFTVAYINDSLGYTWKMEYQTGEKPMAKDYRLVYEKSSNRFVVDEGDGIKLYEYPVQNKMYSMFEVSGSVLTASYELVGEQLIFEVTSGKKFETVNGVSNYSVDGVQRVVLKRVK